MAIHKYLIGLIVFSLFIITFTGHIGELNTTYNVTVDDEDFQTIQTEANSLFNQVEDTTESQYDSSLGDEFDENIEDSMFGGAFKGLQFITGTFGLADKVINTIASKIGIPEYFIRAAILVITIFIAFSIIYLVFRVGKGA